MKNNIIFYYKTAHILMLLCLSILIGRLTQGMVIVFLAVVGAVFAITGKRAWAVLLYMSVPLLTIINPIIMTRADSFSMVSRLMIVFMSVLLWISSLRARRDIMMPLGGLFVYLFVATISSLQGILPLISILKVINVTFFLAGLYLGTRDLSHDVEGVIMLRAGFLAFTIVIVIGSLLTLPFPSIAYYISVSSVINQYGTEYAESLLLSSDFSSLRLLCGITWQSQTLAPLLALANAWLLCDMLMIKKRLDKLYLFLLICIPPMLYMTRSRAGLVAYVISLVFTYKFALRAKGLSYNIKARLKYAMVVISVISVLLVGIWGLKSESLRQWVRKTDDVAGDTRTFWEAFTSSRMGLIENAWESFLNNPLLGIGFQVSERQLSYKGSISLFSAPIEKGFIFSMILEETGVVGFIVFVGFIFSFIYICNRKKLFATLILFFTFIATNLAEATFFSPGGNGGLLWCYVAGGLVIDTMSICGQRMKMFYENIAVGELNESIDINI